MPAEPRPTNQNTVTLENFALGLPVVEFAPVIAGVAQPFIPLGIVDNAALQKELESIEMEDGSPGLRSTVLELVTKVTPTFTVGVFNWSAEVLRFALGAQTLTGIIADPAAVVTNERVTTTLDPLDFLDLVNSGINAGSVVVTPAQNVDEAVGTGDGTAGNGSVSGDFSLDFKVRLVADVTGVQITAGAVVTPFTPIAVGAAASGNEVEVVVGTGNDSGNLQFFVGGVATNVSGIIEATYEPSFVLTEGPADGANLAVDIALSDDGGVFTNETTDINSAALDDVTLTPAVPAVADAFYYGSTNGRFDRVRNVISAGQEGVDYTVVWEYSQGAGVFAALPNVTDESNGFLNAGVSDTTFDVPADWVPDTVDSEEAHWIRARVATVGTPTGATGTQSFLSDANDYVPDIKSGRLQVHTDVDKATGINRPLIAGQAVFVDYTYERLARTDFQPFTQPTTAGLSRIRLLSDQGINIIWTVPSSQIQVSGDDLTFDDENFMIAPVTLTVLDAGGTDRFGTIQHFTKTQAGNV